MFKENKQIWFVNVLWSMLCSAYISQFRVTQTHWFHCRYLSENEIAVQIFNGSENSNIPVNFDCTMSIDELERRTRFFFSHFLFHLSFSLNVPEKCNMCFLQLFQFQFQSHLETEYKTIQKQPNEISLACSRTCVYLSSFGEFCEIA